jgi:hypothetical protein
MDRVCTVPRGLGAGVVLGRGMFLFNNILKVAIYIGAWDTMTMLGGFTGWGACAIGDGGWRQMWFGVGGMAGGARVGLTPGDVTCIGLTLGDGAWDGRTLGAGARMGPTLGYGARRGLTLGEGVWRGLIRGGAWRGPGAWCTSVGVVGCTGAK